MRACVRGWLDKDISWLAPHDGSPGRPAVFSDAAIQFCLTIKVLFKLPLRQTTGMVACLLKMAGVDWAVPDYKTLCRRQRTLRSKSPIGAPMGLSTCLSTAPGSSFQVMVPSRGLRANRCRVTNGRSASTVFRGGANGARSIWPWIQPLRTSAPWNLPPAAMATSSR